MLQKNEIISHRSVDADILKSVSIAAVVFIHSCYLIPFFSPNFDGATAAFRFSVPIFILLWAYFTEKSIAKRRENYIKIRFIKLFIPFIFWSTVYFLLTADLSAITLTTLLTKHWSGYGWAGQYYFIILFQLLPIFFILSIIGKKLLNFVYVIILLSILFYTIVSYSELSHISIISKLGDRPFFYWVPYMLLGIIYANSKRENPIIPLFVGLIAPLIMVMEYLVYYKYHSISLSPYLFPSVFISSLLILNSILGRKFHYVISAPWLIVPIGILSRNTLGIFCINPLIIKILSNLYKHFFLSNIFRFYGCSIILPLLSTTIVISLCLVVIYVLKRTKLRILVEN